MVKLVLRNKTHHTFPASLGDESSLIFHKRISILKESSVQGIRRSRLFSSSFPSTWLPIFKNKNTFKKIQKPCSFFLLYRFQDIFHFNFLCLGKITTLSLFLFSFELVQKVSWSAKFLHICTHSKNLWNNCFNVPQQSVLELSNSTFHFCSHSVQKSSAHSIGFFCFIQVLFNLFQVQYTIKIV